MAAMRSNPEKTDRFAYLDALGIDVWRLRGNDEPLEAPDTEQATGSHASWSDIRAEVSNCQKCALHQTRTQTVFGVGSETADWMIIGEAPGAEEERRGAPLVGRAGKLRDEMLRAVGLVGPRVFLAMVLKLRPTGNRGGRGGERVVGRAGKWLDEMLRAVGLERQTVFIANVLKCRPPGNRDPLADESSQCRAYLDRQIELLKPKLILAVGRIAAQLLLGTDAPLGRLRGRQHKIGPAEIPVVITYHPAYLLRSPAQKRKVWEDLCLARSIVQQASSSRS